MKYKTYLYEPITGRDEKKFVNDCLNSNWISSKGKYIEKFEKRFSNFIKIKYSITVSNGTAALHLALLALNIKKGDEVIVPTFTYISPVNAIKYVGAKVKFIDSKLKTWQIDETKLEKMITKKTKAVIVPHLYGQVSEIKKISKICKKKKIFLIEDCAEAFGCYYGKKHLGVFGDISTFSFFGSKTITTGEGGMVVTNNKKLADKVFKLKMVGVVKNRYYWHDIIGYNYRMTNICAAIGLGQLNKARNILVKKREVFKNYYSFLKNSHLQINNEIKNTKPSYWLINVFLANKKIRDGLAKYLKRNKIETRNTFNLVHNMPMYFKKNQKNLFPNAQILSNTGLSLPSGPNLSKLEISKISSLVKNYLKKFNIKKTRP
jgi:perosamine synthetase